jgi:GNAT superfamily N-acetyltransferase
LEVNMPQILTGYDIPTLGAAIARNHWQFYSIYARQPEVQMYEQHGLGWLSSKVPITYLNQVMYTHLAEAEVAARIDEMRAHYRRLGNQFVWRTWPHSTPANLGEQLLAHGFTTRNLAPNMAADLHNLPTVAAPPNLTVERISSPAHLERWAEVIQSVYDTPATFTRFLVSAFHDEAQNPAAAAANYLAWRDGQPVATTTLFLGAGVGGIYRVATLPQCRGQGIGGAIVLAAMRDALAAGYRFATLRSSEMAYHLYQQLGFRDKYHTLSYLSPP